MGPDTGQAAAVRPADVLFQAVQVPAGRHRLTLSYEPVSFKLGVAATVLGLILTAGLALSALWRPIRRRRHGR